MAKKKNDKIKVIDSKKNKKRPKVMLKKGDFEQFAKRRDIMTILAKLKLQFSGKDAYELNKFCKKITMTPEYEGYMETKQQMIDKFNEKNDKQKNPKKKLPPLLKNIKGLEELMAEDSGIEIEKHVVDVAKFPDWSDPERRFTALDQEELEFAFEFIAS